MLRIDLSPRWLLLIAVLACGLSGCAFSRGAPPRDTGLPVPMVAPPASAGGSIYAANPQLVLFEDVKARAVGDILTIVLNEQTNATKSAASSTSKSSDFSAASPTVLGQEVTYNGIPVLSAEVDNEFDFAGEGQATQSNQLQGSVTVTVVERLPNGNLLVSGEKRLTLNQGQEYVRISGIVRPVDINPDNTIPSQKVANARIAYSGRGAIADSNRQSWLARFFNSPWMPF